MCEHSNISPAVALREARRKKILENSADRLKRIEGINSSAGKILTESSKELKIESDVKPTESFVKKTSNSDLNSKFNDAIKNSKELKEISDILLQHFDQIPKNEEGEIDEQEEEDIMTNTFEPKKKDMFLKVIFQKRLHYVFLALTINVLFFFNAGYFFYENILCPFYTVKIVELLKSRRDERDFQPILLLFIAGLPKSVQKYTKITLTVALALFSDLCLYLFTFIIGNKIFNSLH